MISSLLWVVAGFLLICSIIDWKIKVLPSIFLTGFLFVVAFLNPSNLWFGIMAFIIAFLLYEGNYFSGVADIKILTMMGFMVSTTNNFIALILLTSIFGVIWKILIKWRFRKERDVAFIPVFLFVYITLWKLGGLA